MTWQDKIVLVTGAGGFIGSHLAEALVRLGANTRALIHYNSIGSCGWLQDSQLKPDIEIVYGDITDPYALKPIFKGVDTVFHLAALIAIPYSYTSPQSYVTTNINGTLNVLQNSLDAGVSKVIHTSTSEVYGTAEFIPINESHPLQGQSPYSATKIAADKLAEAYRLSFNLPVTTIRPFNTYGPRQSQRAIIPTIIAQALYGSEIKLGTTTATRDFNYVYDTVQGFLLAAIADADGETINIGTGIETSVDKLVRIVSELTECTNPIVQEQDRLRPKDSEVWRLCADNQKAQDLIGWQPTYSLKEGLIATIDWIKEHSKDYDPVSYKL